MKRREKEALREIFAAPAPCGKRDFFRKMNLPAISQREFVLRQVGYVGKSVWEVSAAVLILALLEARRQSQDMLWILSALTPFVALTIATESGRSEACGMAELEMTARFSLKSLVLARMEIVGMMNLLLLCSFFIFTGQRSAAMPGRDGVYLLTPYLLTADCGLWIVRRVRGREGNYICFGAAVLVSAIELLLRQNIPFLFGAEAFWGWFVALVVFMAGFGLQMKLFVGHYTVSAYEI